MDALLTSTVLVTTAEIGDKTQLLSLMLAARYRRPWPIAAGVLIATLANHALAALAGQFTADLVAPDILRWLVGLFFVAIGIWALFPDDEPDGPSEALGRLGCFGVALVTFFLAEMGDKTQLATVALGARFDALGQVVVGTTLGMMLANAPAIWFGSKLGPRVPLKVVRGVAGALFVGMGLVVLAGPWLGL